MAIMSRRDRSTMSIMNSHSKGSRTPERLLSSARASWASASAPQCLHAQLERRNHGVGKTINICVCIDYSSTV